MTDLHRTPDGELVDQPPQRGNAHDPRCRDGWLPPTLDERPVPCLACRPNLARAVEERRRRQQRRPADPSQRARAMEVIRAELADVREHRSDEVAGRAS